MIVVLSVVLNSAPAHAQLTYQLGNTLLDIDVVLDSTRVNIPWEILWGPDDRLWMTDGPLITRWDPLTDHVDTLLQRTYGNGLGMALHPDFPATPEVIAIFDKSAYYSNGDTCEVSRFTYDVVNDALVNETVLFKYYHAGEHAGGRVLFDTTGNVLITTGDYIFAGPDTLFSTNGKTLRFATDGSVPPDNPRADRTWTWGHRNPQGLTMLPNGAIVNSEHGQLGFTNEINLLQRNEDHGYPFYDGNNCLFFPDTCATAYTYTHPMWTFWHPPSGTEFYDHTLIPELENKLITGILWHTGLMLFSFSTALDSITAEEYLSGGPFDAMVRNRDIAIRPDGTFYLITNDRQEARIRWVHPHITTGLEESSAPNFSIAPNPVNDLLTITPELGLNPSSISVVDTEGRIVHTARPARYGATSIATTGWSSGMYTVRLTHAHGISTQRFVKQ